MPKHKNTREKLYMTHGELIRKNIGVLFKKYHKDYFIPYNYCSLSLQPLNFCKNICCDRQGNLYNKFYLLEYVTKYHKNPITGEPHMTIKDIIDIKFSVDKNNEFQCPVTYKLLNNSIKTMAIPETGNVFSYEAYKELNQSMNCYKDLINDKPFDKKNIIILNDPTKRKVVKNFHYQNQPNEVEFMNKLVNNTKNYEKSLIKNISIDNKYEKIINDYENEFEKGESSTNHGIKLLDDFNLIYDQEKENKKEEIFNNKNPEQNNPAGLYQYQEIKEQIKKISQVIIKLNKNINYFTEKEEKKLLSFLDFDYKGFYCFMLKENLWQKYFRNQILTSLTKTNELLLKNTLSATSTLFKSKDLSNLNTDYVPSYKELSDIYYIIIKSRQLKVTMVVQTNIGDIIIDLWSHKLTEIVEQLYEEISLNDDVEGFDYLNLLDDEYLIFNKEFDFSIEKDKKVRIEKGIVEGPYIGYMKNQKKICFYTDQNKFINKDDIYIIGIVINEEEDHVLENVFKYAKHRALLKKNKNFEREKDDDENEGEIKGIEKGGEVVVERIMLFNNPYIDTMKEVIFREIKEKYLKNIYNDEINNELKMINKLEDIKNGKDNSIGKDNNTIGKYLEKKRKPDKKSLFNDEVYQKFLEKES